MRTVTLTRVQALALTLPGDIPGLMRRLSPGVWSGPLRHHLSVLEARWGPLQPAGRLYVNDGGSGCQWCDATEVALDLSDWTGRTHVARWLTEGERCGACNGSGYVRDTHNEIAPCASCQETGWSRKPSPAFHLLDIANPGIEAAWSAACLWASVGRVRAGLGPVAGVLGEWTRGCNYGDWWATRQPNRRFGVAGDVSDEFSICEECPNKVKADHRQWYFNYWTADGRSLARAEGPEHGDLGMAAADRAATTTGLALLNGTDDEQTITLSVPETA